VLRIGVLPLTPTRSTWNDNRFDASYIVQTSRPVDKGTAYVATENPDCSSCGSLVLATTDVSEIAENAVLAFLVRALAPCVD
jgi:hypothetical protein